MGATFAVALVLAACDTGDGKTLRTPTGTTTPPSTAPLSSVPIDATLPAEDVEDVDLTIPLPTDDVDGEFQMFGPWIEGAPIGVRYSCEGDNISPALSWASIPAGTTELAVAMIDESAEIDGRPFVHWVVAGIDPADISLLEGDVPLGAVQGVNSFEEIGYGGPCPPQGDPAHTYRITLYALNQQTELADGTPATDLLDFVEEVAIGSVDLTGTFVR